MDKILDFMANYYYIFLIVAVVLVFALIGFIAESKRKEKKNMASMQTGGETAAPATPEVATVAPAPEQITPVPSAETVAPAAETAPAEIAPTEVTPVAPTVDTAPTPVAQPTLQPVEPVIQTQPAPVEPVLPETPVINAEPTVMQQAPVVAPTNDLVGSVPEAPSIPSINDTFIVDAPITEPVTMPEAPQVPPTSQN